MNLLPNTLKRTFIMYIYMHVQYIDTLWGW